MTDPLPDPYAIDAPTIADGGRVRLDGKIRSRAGWPTKESYSITFELIEPGYVELHVMGLVEQRVKAAREWARRRDDEDAGGDRVRTMDDVFQYGTFDADDGRLQVPSAVLAYLGVFPRESTDEETSPSQVKATRRKPLARFGGQQLIVQANDRSISMMSVARRAKRTQHVLDESAESA